MKKPVNDDLVAEYAKRLHSGGTVGSVFPCPLSECDFTDAQRAMIQEARKVRRQLIKKSKAPKPTALVQPPISKPQSLSMLEKLLYPAAPKTAVSKSVAPKPPTFASIQAPESEAKFLTKREKILYLQQGKCFFCGEKLALKDANIEHLNPLSLGGKSTPDNLVVCHKSLNDTFGDLPLKQKFEFVLKAAGSFRCPKN